MSKPTIEWRKYRSGMWHAWEPGETESVCDRARLSRASEKSEPEPRGRICRICSSRVRRRDPDAHRTDGPCACETCRSWRRREAEMGYAGTVAPPKRACRCVQEWPRSREYVADAETRLWALLLVWEFEGSSVAARDVEDAERAYRRAWHEAADAYERLDGSHPHRRAGR